ncbi:hypothetical protein A5875_002004 [Enterococcus sp. 3H8_DIV0648]|nr:hypothetical protein A5875_002004 [Enterococcus sp. 3H8_DIV0648]
MAVSYTHLDVYKRQYLYFLFDEYALSFYEGQELCNKNHTNKTFSI